MVRLIVQLNLNLEKGLNLKFSLKEPLFILFYFKPTPEKRFQSDTQLKKTMVHLMLLINLYLKTWSSASRNHGASNATPKAYTWRNVSTRSLASRNPGAWFRLVVLLYLKKCFDMILRH